MNIEELDEIDNKILEIIKDNARLSYSEIAEQVGLSRVSVKNRMLRLEQNGVIQGYATIIYTSNLPYGKKFFLDVMTEPDSYAQVVDNLAKYDIIRRVFAVTGECRLWIEGYASSPMKYEMFMKNLKRNLDGIVKIDVMDVQYTIKDSDAGVDYVRLDEQTEVQLTLPLPEN